MKKLKQRLEHLKHGLYRDFEVDVRYAGKMPELAMMHGEIEAPLGWMSVKALDAEPLNPRCWRVRLRGIWVGQARAETEQRARAKLLGYELWVAVLVGFLAGVGVTGMLVRL